VSYADVVEGVRAAIAVYTQALDDGRVDELVATFCADGSIDIPGMGAHAGHDALRTAYADWTPRMPQRHLVTNTLVTEWNDREARAVSDFAFLLRTDAGWSVQAVGRYDDTLRCEDGTWRFHRRTADVIR
jgi:hypothetical protein